MLRQILNTKNYTISSREKYMKGCKFIIYNLCKLESKKYKPLLEIKETINPDKPIILNFN